MNNHLITEDDYDYAAPDGERDSAAILKETDADITA